MSLKFFKQESLEEKLDRLIKERGLLFSSAPVNHQIHVKAVWQAEYDRSIYNKLGKYAAYERANKELRKYINILGYVK